MCDRRGALFFPALRLLVVSDLHLEKGSSFARRGMLMPPYDTAATLCALQAVIAELRSARSSSASATAFTTARAPRGCPASFRADLSR